MYNILTLNAIAKVGLDKLPADNFAVSENTENPDGIILRSYDMHQMELPSNLKGVARAGAGTNNIPIDKCSEKGIVVFNSPGANANAVKELVLTGILLSSRKIVDGIEWVKTLKGQENVDKLVEKGKSKFVGPEIEGKTLGVIGLGAIGVLVANSAKALGMNVIGYDPFLSVDSAWKLNSSIINAKSMEEVVAESDYITIHVPLNDKTRNTFNKDLFAATKKGARLLNLARGELVETEALKEALADGTIACYVTDFPNSEVIELENVIAIPHLGASTPESEDKCAIMAAMELRDFLEYGNIKNSVNFPNCEIPYTGKSRVSIAHKNIPNMVSSIANVFAKEGINIDNMLNKSKGSVAYTLIDVDNLFNKNEELVKELEAIEGVAKARVVK